MYIFAVVFAFLYWLALFYFCYLGVISFLKQHPNAVYCIQHPRVVYQGFCMALKLLKASDLCGQTIPAKEDAHDTVESSPPPPPPLAIIEILNIVECSTSEPIVSEVDREDLDEHLRLRVNSGEETNTWYYIVQYKYAFITYSGIFTLEALSSSHCTGLESSIEQIIKNQESNYTLYYETEPNDEEDPILNEAIQQLMGPRTCLLIPETEEYMFSYLHNHVQSAVNSVFIHGSLNSFHVDLYNEALNKSPREALAEQCM